MWLGLDGLSVGPSDVAEGRLSSDGDRRVTVRHGASVGLGRDDALRGDDLADRSRHLQGTRVEFVESFLQRARSLARSSHPSRSVVVNDFVNDMRTVRTAPWAAVVLSDGAAGCDGVGRPPGRTRTPGPKGGYKWSICRYDRGVARPVLKLSDDRTGYTLNDERVDGFPDQPSLPPPLRHRIARWANAFTPDAMDAAQAEILQVAQSRDPSPSRQRAAVRSAFLESPVIRALWNTLDLDKRGAVLNPDQALGDGSGFPLTVGALSRLTGVDRQTLRRWPLPATRNEQQHREYGAAAAVMALAMKGSKQNDREFFADIRRSTRPLNDLRRSMALLTYLAFNNENPVPISETTQELEELATDTRALADALDTMLEVARAASSHANDVGSGVEHPPAASGEMNLRRLGATARLVEPGSVPNIPDLEPAAHRATPSLTTARSSVR